jgi:deoxyribodipyrimidine photolyase
VLGEKSVTPIKKIVHQTPSFQARRGSRSLQRRLRKERSQKKLVSDENEWRDDKLNAKDKGNTESPINAIAEQKQTVKARTKTHHSKNDSPLRKFAAAQKQTSLRKAANLPRRTSFKSSKKSPNPVTSKSSQDQESSEYDSGTERARQELDDFLQRKSGSGNKPLKAEKI